MRFNPTNQTTNIRKKSKILNPLKFLCKSFESLRHLETIVRYYMMVPNKPKPCRIQVVITAFFLFHVLKIM
jgi:hypothetical protein